MPLRLFSIVLLFLVTLGSNAQDPLHRRFTMQHGLPSNTVYRSMEDLDGFLWLSTDAGAVRFDGTHLDPFGLDQGLTDQDVFATKCDTKGRIWFFTANGLPCYVEGGQVHSGRTDTTLAKVQLRSGIGSFHEDADGTLWFGGLRSEIAIVYPDGKVLQHDVSDPVNGIGGLPVRFHLMDDGRMQVINGKLPVELSEREFTGHFIGDVGWASVPHPTQEPMLVVEPDSVEEWREDHWSLLITRYELPGQPSMASAMQVSDDELWVGLNSGGVLWLRREAGRWVSVRDVMFSQDLVTHVLRDRDGNIWLSTSYGGVILIPATSSSTSFFTGVRGGNEEFLRAHASDAVGIWVGTNQGDVYHLEEELVLVDLPPQGPLFSRVSCIISSDQELWVSTEHRTMRFDRWQRAAQVDQMHILPARPDVEVARSGVKALAIAPDGSLIASSYGLLEFDARMNAFRRIIDPALNTIRIYAPHFDVHGTLWFEENGLLVSFSKDGFRSYPEFELEAGYRITGITSIGDTLFLSTNGKGILVLVDARPLRYVTQVDGLSSDHIQRMFADRGELFLVTKHGADRLSGPWTAPAIRSRFVGLSGAARRLRDVVADSSNAYLVLADGLLVFPRYKETVARGVPVPYVRSVQVNDHRVFDDGTVGIKGRRDRLVVEFGAIHFTEPERLSLQYRLHPGADRYSDLLN